MDQHGTRLENLIVLATVSVLVVATFVVLRPFLTAIVWALILALATWPTFKRFEQFVNGRRPLAALLMTVLLAVGLLLPLTIVGTSLADSVVRLADLVAKALAEGPPGPPDILKDLPYAGEYLYGYWERAAADTDKLAADLAQEVRPAANWLLGIGAKLGGGLLEVALSILIAFFVYRDGADIAGRLTTMVRRLGGARGVRLLDVAQSTVKGVVWGILGTALVQATLAGIGFWIAGVPGAFFLSVVIFFLCITPIGAPIVWAPATIWLFYTGETGRGIFMGLWGFFVVSTIDNVLKPLLVGLASALPVLLVYLGILGGALAFGFLGIFIGPTVLSVGFTLVKEWTAGIASSPEASPF